MSEHSIERNLMGAVALSDDALDLVVGGRSGDDADSGTDRDDPTDVVWEIVDVDVF